MSCCTNAPQNEFEMTMDELFDGSNAHLMTHVVPTNDLREHDTDGQRWADSSPYQNALHELAELRAQLADTSACANMLALELECLLMDTADLSVQSRWWDSSMQALVAWQNLDDQPHVSLLGVD